MLFLAYKCSVVTSLVLLLSFVPGFSAQDPGNPLLQRSYVDSLDSVFDKRDDCTTQYGPTYVDCGSRGCFQPSLGETCCGANNMYCPEGQFCAGNHCCPNGLNAACCITGYYCPANASDYYTSSLSTTAAAATTSLPVSISTSFGSSKTSTEETTSVAIPATTAVASNTKSTNSVVAGTATTTKAGVGTNTSSGAPSTTFTQVSAGSGAQERRILAGVEGLAIGALGIVGFVAGLI